MESLIQIHVLLVMRATKLVTHPGQVVYLVGNLLSRFKSAFRPNNYLSNDWIPIELIE